MSSHPSSTSVLRPRVIEEGTASNNHAAQSQHPNGFRRSQIRSDVYAAFFELIGTVESSPGECCLWLALTSRWTPDRFCYVRTRRYPEYSLQSGTHWRDLRRPTPVHFGIDGVLFIVYCLALRKVRDFGF